MAASVPTETNPNPDWTAGVKISRDSLGYYYIEHSKRFQKLTDGVIREIIETAQYDGDTTTVTIPRDTGAGGKTANQFMIRTLAENGVPARSVQMSGHSGKLQRFLPFCSLAEAGNVFIVDGDWNETYLLELENFTGHRKNVDDQVDATSDAFNSIARGLQIPTFVLPDLSRPSIQERLK